MAKGILIAAMNIGGAAEDEFHDWYDTEHLPERQRVPGFLLCQRWIGVQDPKVSVATYDLDSASVLQSPAYRAIGGDNLSPWSKRVTIPASSATAPPAPAPNPSPASRERVPERPARKRVRVLAARNTLTLPALQAGSLPLPRCGRGANLASAYVRPDLLRLSDPAGR